MITLWKDLMTAVLVGMILPGMMLNGAVMLMRAEEPASNPQPTVQETRPGEIQIPVSVKLPDGTVRIMELDTYIVGVVLAEMPASFEPEALKAQAVAARTYARKAAVTGGKHGDGSVCGVSSCCQSYIAVGDYLEQGGRQEGVEKVRTAVRDTAGQVLTYDGVLIEATYFSCSGGMTEDAAAVWGTDVPYLQAVSSPGEENAEHYLDTVTFSPRQFQQLLGVTLPGDPESWFGFTTYTKGGGIASMDIGGTVYTGTQLRSLLGLRSASFSVQPSREGIIIVTRGYGHRVGMSQYGADAMAVTGSSCEEILAHYYPGTALEQLRIDENGELVYDN